MTGPLVIERVPMSLDAALALPAWRWARWTKKTRGQVCSRWHRVHADDEHLTRCGLNVPGDREVYLVAAMPHDGEICVGCQEARS